MKLSDLYNRTVTDIEQFNNGGFVFLFWKISIWKFVVVELCQTQSTSDAQCLADTIQILTVLIPHVHETILNQVKSLLSI